MSTSKNDLPSPATTPAPSLQKQQRALKWICAGLGCLIFGGIAYSQPLGREAGVHLLGLAGPPAIPWLLSAFEDSSAHVQKAAYDEISGLGPPAVPNLLAELNRSKASTRINAAGMLRLRALHAGSEAKIRDGLLKLLEDNDRLVKLAAMNSLASLGPAASAALPALTGYLDDIDAKMRVGAMYAVVSIDRDSPETLSIVLKMLKDSQPKVRKVACSALEDIGTRDPHAIAALIEVLHDPVPEVRMAAADYLGEIGPEGKVAIPALQDMADNDPISDVRSKAAQSIKELSPP